MRIFRFLNFIDSPLRFSLSAGFIWMGWCIWKKKIKNFLFYQKIFFFFRIKQSAVAINVKVQRQRGAQKRNRKRNYFGRRPSIKQRCQTAGKSGKNPLMHYYCRWMLRPHVSFFSLFTTLHTTWMLVIQLITLLRFVCSYFLIEWILKCLTLIIF